MFVWVAEDTQARTTLTHISVICRAGIKGHATGKWGLGFSFRQMRAPHLLGDGCTSRSFLNLTVNLPRALRFPKPRSRC